MSQFEYVAVLISIIVGLALTQILRGVGRMVTTKDGPRPYWVHLVWTFYLFFLIVMFWWWEFQLRTVDWSLWVYLVVITYATLLFFVSLVVQPGRLDGISSYREYYYFNRRWIFGLFICIPLWDFVDTLSKGANYFLSLGTEYLVVQLTQIIGYAVAIITRNERYHKIFATVWMIVITSYLVRTFLVID